LEATLSWVRKPRWRSISLRGKLAAFGGSAVLCGAELLSFKGGELLKGRGKAFFVILINIS